LLPKLNCKKILKYRITKIKDTIITTISNKNNTIKTTRLLISKIAKKIITITITTIIIRIILKIIKKTKVITKIIIKEINTKITSKAIIKITTKVKTKEKRIIQVKMISKAHRLTMHIIIHTKRKSNM